MRVVVELTVKTALYCVMPRLTICILCMLVLGMKGVLDPNMELLLCSGVLYCTVLYCTVVRWTHLRSGTLLFWCEATIFSFRFIP